MDTFWNVYYLDSAKIYPARQLAVTSSLLCHCFWSRISRSETWLSVGGAGFVPCWFLKYLSWTWCCYVCSGQRDLSKFRHCFSWSLKTNWKSLSLSIFKWNEHFFFPLKCPFPVIFHLNWAKTKQGCLTRQSDFGHLLKWLWRPAELISCWDDTCLLDLAQVRVNNLNGFESSPVILQQCSITKWGGFCKWWATHIPASAIVD